MKRGVIEFDHNGENDTIMIANRENLTKYEFKTSDFAKDFLQGHLNWELSEEEKKEKDQERILVDRFFRQSAMITDPDDKKHGESLVEWLDTQQGEEFKVTQPPFETEVLIQFNKEKGGLELTMKGISEDIIRSFHTCMGSSIKFENLMLRATSERFDMINQATKLRIEGGKKKD